MIYFVIAIAIVIIDQVTKYYAQSYLQAIHTIPIIQDIFHLTYARNTGAAFSILRNKQLFLIIMTSIVTLVLILYLFKNRKDPSILLKISIAFIIGGAIGNLIDRIRFNYVIDFFYLVIINYPIFNVADIFVVVGAILIGYGVIFKKIEI